ncbi:hypothetical protein NMY22_g6413 [Coprinellus aureogranulatus]|nr:hypothetical protein NMY22_g6413 [Coprinellus aureogranulatus]
MIVAYHALGTGLLCSSLYVAWLRRSLLKGSHAQLLVVWLELISDLTHTLVESEDVTTGTSLSLRPDLQDRDGVNIESPAEGDSRSPHRSLLLYSALPPYRPCLYLDSSFGGGREEWFLLTLPQRWRSSMQSRILLTPLSTPRTLVLCWLFPKGKSRARTQEAGRISKGQGRPVPDRARISRNPNHECLTVTGAVDAGSFVATLMMFAQQGHTDGLNGRIAPLYPLRVTYQHPPSTRLPRMQCRRRRKPEKVDTRGRLVHSHIRPGAGPYSHLREGGVHAFYSLPQRAFPGPSDIDTNSPK